MLGRSAAREYQQAQTRSSPNEQFSPARSLGKGHPTGQECFPGTCPFLEEKKKKRQPLPDINEHDCSRVHRKKILFSLQWWGGAPLPEPAGSTTLPPPANTEGMPGRVFSFGQHTWDQPEQFYRCFINWHLIHSSWKWCTSWTDRWATCSNGSIGLCFISLISQSTAQNYSYREPGKLQLEGKDRQEMNTENRLEWSEKDCQMLQWTVMNIWNKWKK